MKEHGIFNPSLSITTMGLKNLGQVYYNLTPAELYEYAIRQGEARLTAHGALAAVTGQHTGRSPQDKFIVRDAQTENAIWWEGNKPMSPQHFDDLHADFIKHAEGRDLFVQDLIGGADPDYALCVRVVSEYAWHALFIRNLLIRPQRADLRTFVPQMTILNLPSFAAKPERHGCRTSTVIACDLSRLIVLIGGTSYAGEMKKSVFTTLNFLLPPKGVMPMHCSANQGKDDDSAIFFGLSGTGKTTLSADSSRTLIGDDEHGWSDAGIFNFEGGCYAKTIRLSENAEPEIYATTKMFGTVLENVVLDETREPDFDDDSLTENTRCAYPLPFIANASKSGCGTNPKNIIMLTADAFGILPPIARLTPAQAMFHFLSGYTAKVAGTEKGVSEPEATFSTCFGAPFMPRHPVEYGNLLRQRIAKHKVDCWLINTGWTGGPYGVGKRMPIRATRILLSAVLDGSLKNVAYRCDEIFGFEVPIAVPDIDGNLLNPRRTWSNSAAYDAQGAKLASMFVQNFTKFSPHVDDAIRAAGPKTEPFL